MSTTTCLSCLLPAAIEEELPELLAPFDTLGCHFETASAGRILVWVYLPGASSPDALAAELERRGAERLAVEIVADQDWLAAYRSQVRPMPVGRLWWMDPHPGRPTPAPAARQRLVIEPRSAFGTGSHESTQLLLLELEELRLDDAAVLDVGTGSGVLALAAERRGATFVVGVDNDPQAVWTAREIAGQQEWQARSLYLVGSTRCLAGASFQLVLCNMIPAQFVPLLEDIRGLLESGGTALFSGILGEQRASVRSELAAHGLEAAGERQLGEWCALRAERRR